MQFTHIPLEYQPGFRRARALNPNLADRYLKHTTIGDPAADAACAAVAHYDEAWIARLLRAGIAQDKAGLREAPGPLREFFERASRPPGWLDQATLEAGCPAFRRERDAFILALLAGGLVRVASTLISRSLFMSGRFQRDAARRLRYLTRLVIEVTLPGGLEPRGDGWKYAVRTRFAHAQVRRIIRESGAWDELLYGVPLSGAHLGFTVCNFSAMLIRDVERLGPRLTQGERAGYMHIWRYTAHLLGVPKTLLPGDEEDANELGRIAIACEPHTSATSVAIANALILAVPAVIGISIPRERRALARYCYRVSRALVGDELADRLKFPRLNTTWFLRYVQCQRRLVGLFERLVGRTLRTGSKQVEGLAELDVDKTRMFRLLSRRRRDR